MTETWKGSKWRLVVKMAHFLLDAGSWSKRLFSASWCVLYAYRISFVHAKVGGGAENLSPAHFRLATPTSKNDRFWNFSPSRTSVPNFLTFHCRLGPQKCVRLGRRRRRRNIYIYIYVTVNVDSRGLCKLTGECVYSPRGREMWKNEPTADPNPDLNLRNRDA